MNEKATGCKKSVASFLYCNKREFLVLFSKYLRFSRVTSQEDNLRFLCDLGEKVEKSRGAGVIELGEDLVEDHGRSVGGEEH